MSTVIPLWLTPLLAQGEAADPWQSMFGSMMLPMLLMMAAFYFLMVRPDQQKRKQHEKQLEALKKNDEVVTTGGICGTVVNAAPGTPYVIIRVDDNTNTRLRVLRSAILQVGGAGEGSEKTTGETQAD
jgi:preprotein translocase subunit YajC